MHTIPHYNLFIIDTIFTSFYCAPIINNELIAYPIIHNFFFFQFYSEADVSSRPLTREFKRKKEMINDSMSNIANQTTIDETWWKNYFERKMELEREKLAKEDERHKDRMNFQKMAIMLQERVEKVKVESMNNLTNALLRLQEASAKP